MELVNELYAFCSRTAGLKPGRDADDPETVGAVERPATIAVVKEAIEALVLMLSPFTPHMCEELWELLGHRDGVVAAGWPAFDEAVARAAEVVVPVQVNGRVRARVTVAADIADNALKQLALEDPAIVKQIEGKTVKKVVLAGSGPNRLVSVVVAS
jgi:leucyl-tRNA synthetase